MKKQLIYVSFFLLGLFGSCSMDFDTYKEVPESEFWKTEEDAVSSVVACYGKLVDWPFFEPTTFMLQEVISGNTVKGSTRGDQEEMNIIPTFGFTPSASIFNTFWNSRYSVINVCNQAITNIPFIEMDEDKKKSLIGEARFIRAWIYFELVRTFGEVIIYDGLPEKNNYNIPKSSIADVYEFIEQDLEYGYKYMNKTPWPKDMKGRVTAWSARALLAKVKMYEASGANFMEDGLPINGATWQQVKEITDDVIQNGIFELYTKDGEQSFFYMFRIQNENCDESILEAQCGASKDAEGINRSAYAVYQWVRGGSGWGFNIPSDEIIADWEARTDDKVRYKASIIYRGDVLSDGSIIEGSTELYGTNAGKPGYKPARYNYKVYIADADKGQHSDWKWGLEQNPRLFRFADVLLIDAEAEFNLGNISEALESVNKIRNRAYATPFTSGTISLQAIWDERRFELAFENDRYFDIVRTGQVKTLLASKGFISPKNSFYPIPQEQIDLSAGILEQNKYWK